VDDGDVAVGTVCGKRRQQSHGRARRQSAWSGHRPGSEADAQGPRGSVFFPQIIQIGSNLKIGALQCYFFPNICMWLDWDIVNNFLNDANIQVPT
jgi:hypothetical protein